VNSSLPDTVALIWTITLGIGGVVIVCVAILLSLLRAMLIDLDARVAEVDTELAELARNTASSGLLDRAADGIAAGGGGLGPPRQGGTRKAAHRPAC
jgi:hypothetical protein